MLHARRPTIAGPNRKPKCHRLMCIDEHLSRRLGRWRWEGIHVARVQMFGAPVQSRVKAPQAGIGTNSAPYAFLKNAQEMREHADRNESLFRTAAAPMVKVGKRNRVGDDTFRDCRRRRISKASLLAQQSAPPLNGKDVVLGYLLPQVHQHITPVSRRPDGFH